MCSALAQEDTEKGGPGPVAGAAGSQAADIYTSGSTRSSGLPSLNAWLTRQGSMFPDVVEELAMGHLQKGDHMSAMITSEW